MGQVLKVQLHVLDVQMQHLQKPDSWLCICESNGEGWYAVVQGLVPVRGGGSGWLVRVAGAHDCDRDRICFSDRLHPCFPLLHWKHARSSFMAQGSIRRAQWSHRSIMGRIGKLGGGL